MGLQVLLLSVELASSSPFIPHPMVELASSSSMNIALRSPVIYSDGPALVFVALKRACRDAHRPHTYPTYTSR